MKVYLALGKSNIALHKFTKMKDKIFNILKSAWEQFFGKSFCVRDHTEHGIRPMLSES